MPLTTGWWGKFVMYGSKTRDWEIERTYAGRLYSILRVNWLLLLQYSIGIEKQSTFFFKFLS